MEWNATITTFGLIFLAEMGDKTQLAVLSMAAGTDAPWSVFVGAAVALCLVSLLGVFAGVAASRLVSPAVIQRLAAGAFIATGVVMLVRGG